MTLFVIALGLACASLLAILAEALEALAELYTRRSPPDDAPGRPCDRLEAPPALAARRAATAASDGSERGPWRAF